MEDDSTPIYQHSKANKHCDSTSAQVADSLSVVRRDFQPMANRVASMSAKTANDASDNAVAIAIAHA
jgi:hypothetical protein